MINNISELLPHIQGIYIIEYENNKVYIGQAQDIKKRAYEHNNKNKLKCDKALKKLSATIKILQIVDDIALLDKIESEYISKYDSTNPKKGYNIIKTGNVSNKRSFQHPNSKITEVEFNEIVNLLKNNIELSYEEIGKRYNISQITVLSINNGNRYYHNNLNYPIRKIRYNANRKILITDYFKSIKQLEELKHDLKYNWELSIEKDLVKKYNLPVIIIRDINQGRKFKEIGDYNYPIRKPNSVSHNGKLLSKQNVLDILTLLSTTKLTMTEIGKQFKIHRNTVSLINLGKTYLIENYNYPARLTH